MRSTKEHGAVVMVPLALIEGRWRLSTDAGSEETLTGVRRCIEIGCTEINAHPPLPGVAELASILADATDRADR